MAATDTELRSRLTGFDEMVAVVASRRVRTALACDRRVSSRGWHDGTLAQTPSSLTSDVLRKTRHIDPRPTEERQWRRPAQEPLRRVRPMLPTTCSDSITAKRDDRPSPIAGGLLFERVEGGGLAPPSLEPYATRPGFLTCSAASALSRGLGRRP